MWRVITLAVTRPAPFGAKDLRPELKHEIISQAASMGAANDLRGQTAAKGRHLAASVLMALLEVCTRDAAVIAVAWATSLRRSELTGLRRDDFVQTGAEEGDLTVRASVIKSGLSTCTTARQLTCWIG